MRRAAALAGALLGAGCASAGVTGAAGCHSTLAGAPAAVPPPGARPSPHMASRARVRPLTGLRGGAEDGSSDSSDTLLVPEATIAPESSSALHDVHSG